MPIARSIPEVLRAHADAIKGEIRKCLPATVTAVHPSSQTVDVQVAINGVMFDELGTTVSVPAVSIAGVPLGVLRGGSFLVWVPVQVGDSVLLIFSDLSCDTWSASPTGSPAVDPGFVGQHTHDSPFAIPMVSPSAGAFTSPGTDKIIIGKDNSDEQILIGASDIELGRGATDHVALTAKIDTFLNAVKAGSTGTGDSFAAAMQTWATTNWPISSTVGATLVKAQ